MTFKTYFPEDISYYIADVLCQAASTKCIRVCVHSGKRAEEKRERNIKKISPVLYEQPLFVVLTTLETNLIFKIPKLFGPDSRYRLSFVLFSKWIPKCKLL